MTPSSQMAPCLPHPLGRLIRHRSRVWVGFNTTYYGAIILSPTGRSDRMCSATIYKPQDPPITYPMWDFLFVTFSPTQSCDALITDGLPAYPTCWGIWRNIRVGSELAQIPLVTGPLPLSPKHRSDRVCSGTVYKSRTLPLLVQC